jgi:branched-chain amino acid transport system ATP-binding protein
MSGEPEPSGVALDVNRLDAFYGKSQVAFGLSLHIDAGETVAVLGRNGAGKTSLLMAIAGSISSRSDRLVLAGRDISRLPPFKRVRAGLALVPSGSRAFPNLTVEENLSRAERRRSRNGGAQDWSLARVYEVFPILDDLRGARAGALSGGERQMLAVGRALVANPNVLMLDEPSEGLAPIIVRRIGAMLRELNQHGLAVLLTEQNHRVALEIADRAYFIEKGQIAWSGTAEEAKRSDAVGRYLAV